MKKKNGEKREFLLQSVNDSQIEPEFDFHLFDWTQIIVVQARFQMIVGGKEAWPNRLEAQQPARLGMLQ